MCERLMPFGHVTGTDLADEVLDKARERLPGVRFMAGDFLNMEFEPAAFDVAVSLEVLSHVVDQPAFLRRIAGLLRPGGLLMLATQNRPVLERWSKIGPPEPGQIRRWVDAKSLRKLLAGSYELLEMTSLLPVGDQGILRVLNAPKVNRAIALFTGHDRLDALKERWMLGHTLMVLARKRAD
jgi:SAM-dependent methyltransferase